MMGFASSSYVPVAILSLDQKKAFDRVEWHFKRASLSKRVLAPLSFAGLICFILRFRVM